MEEMKSRVYALTDSENRITRIEGEYSLPADLEGWILVEEGTPCDRLNLAQSHYLDKPLMTEDGFYRYKWDRTHIVERTEEEIDADRANVPPTPPTWEERMEAQVLWTAVSTDSYLGEV